MEYICKKNIYSYLLAFLITLCFITIATPSYAFDLDSLLGDEEVDPSFKDLLGEDELPMIGDSDVKREKAASKLDQKDKKNIPVVRKENKEEPNAEAKVEAKPVAKKTAVVEEKKPEEKAAVDKDKGFIPKVLDDLNIFSSDGKDTQKEEKTVKKEVKTEDAGGVVPGLLESLGGGDDLSSAVNQKNEDDLTDVDLGAIEPVEPQAGEKQISAAPKSRIQKLSAGGATTQAKSSSSEDDFMFPDSMESFGSDDGGSSDVVPLSQREGGATSVPSVGAQATSAPDLGGKKRSKSGEYLPPPTYGTNAGLFNVANVMLKMNVEQVVSTLKTAGFVQTIVNKDIPNFVKWKNEVKCQSFGEVVYEKLAYCIREVAKRDGHEYIESIVFNKYSTKERLEVFFTSNFTRNRVYKIEYKAGGDPSLGNTQKDRYLKDVWMRNFYTRVYKKYGNPDDMERYTWSSGENKPFLKVGPGYIVLADPGFLSMDSALMARSDKKSISGETLSF